MTRPRRLGFIGTGTITTHMVRGLKASGLAGWPVILSPRNAANAQALAASLPDVQIARDNQDVIDHAEILVLALRPQIAESVLRPLRFAPDVPVISLMATIQSETLQGWTGATRICRAIPLPFVERRSDVIPVFPPHPEAMEIFAALGQAMPVTGLAAFDAYATASALMATYFGIVGTAVDWMQTEAIPAADAKAYLGALFTNLAQTLSESPKDLATLRSNHATAGGLNEQLHRVFHTEGGDAAITAGLTSVMQRIRSA